MEISLGFAIALLGGAMTAGLAAYGSSVGVGLAGEMAGGVISEDPDRFGLMLILQALPATQAIYGLVVAILVMLKLNALGGDGAVLQLGLQPGLAVFAACVPAMFGELISPIWQGKVAVASMGAVAKKPDTFGRALILPVMVETFGLFALIATLIILQVAIPPFV
jgi:V/A-type H+-transporting ATPase subunit K